MNSRGLCTPTGRLSSGWARRLRRGTPTADASSTGRRTPGLVRCGTRSSASVSRGDTGRFYRTTPYRQVHASSARPTLNDISRREPSDVPWRLRQYCSIVDTGRVWTQPPHRRNFYSTPTIISVLPRKSPVLPRKSPGHGRSWHHRRPAGIFNFLQRSYHCSNPSSSRIYSRSLTTTPPKNNTKGPREENDLEETSTTSQQQKHDELPTTSRQTNSQNDDENPNFWSNWRRAMTSPPNLITTTRLLCSPLLSYWIVTGQHEYALVGCIVAAGSDYVDGYLAKHHNMATVLGGYLDPLADKMIINMLAWSLWYTGILPAPLVALWFTKDILLMVGTASYVRSQSTNNATAFDPTVTPLQVRPTMIGKVNTMLQFVTIGVGIVYPLYSADSSSMIPMEDVLSGLCYVTGATTIASGFSYIDLSAFADSGNEGNKK